jgi:hypothetical protein
MEQTKKCNKCQRILSKSNFSKRNKYLDGLNCWCMECKKKYDKEYREKNKETKKIKDKEYYQKNKEKWKTPERKEKARIWAINNPDKVKERKDIIKNIQNKV